MIVKMKKLTLLCTPAQQEQTLEKLRDLKVVHVEHVQSPDGYKLEQARNHLTYIQRAQEVLSARPDADPTGKDPDKLVERVWELIHKEKQYKETIQGLEHEVARIEPFGEFDPRKIKDLKKEGIFIKLYQFQLKSMPEVPDNVAISEISRDKNSVYVMATAREEFSIAAHEVRLPERSLCCIRRHIEKTNGHLAENEAEFEKYAGDKHLVDAIADEAADNVNYLEVQNGMGAESAIIYLKGFYPVDRETEIATAAKKYGWGYQFDEVAEDDEPPTLLRNPKWVEPVKAVLSMIGVVPSYKELDISALFLIFLSIFFAFLIGDAGYGLLFVGLSLFGKAKGNDAAKPGLNLLMIMSVCTIIWGVLTGTYFGIRFEALPAPLQGIVPNFLQGEGAAANVMFICFTLGALHLTIAHAWNMIRKINSPACLADLGWTCTTWGLYFVVLNMVIEIPYPFPPAILGGVIGIGALLIVISLLCEKAYFGLVTLVLDLISNFVDIISYVRLYAVGAASLAIASAFNDMALDIGFSGLASLGAALILFLGHALNIVLGAMGILVHGIRLNTLEFSGHAGVEWGGYPFNPFKRNKDNI